MAALRFLGSFLLLLAAVVLIADVTNARGPVGGGFTVSLAKHWAGLAPSSLAAAQKSIQAVSPLLWDPLVKTLLAMPAWATFGLLGGLLAWIGRRRRRVNIYVN
jgi:hypothetical protein